MVGAPRRDGVERQRPAHEQDRLGAHERRRTPGARPGPRPVRSTVRARAGEPHATRPAHRRACRVHPVCDDNLEEWDYGDFEGLTTSEVRRRYPGWTIWEGPWPGGETPLQVHQRAQRVVERARTLPPGAQALAFAHGHILRVVAATWLGRPVKDGSMLVLGTATVSVLGWEHGWPAVEHWNVPPPPGPPGPVGPVGPGGDLYPEGDLGPGGDLH